MLHIVKYLTTVNCLYINTGNLRKITLKHKQNKPDNYSISFSILF